MIYIFKTNINNIDDVKKTSVLIDSLIDNSSWSFDLEDCDKILRIEVENLNIKYLQQIFNENGFFCDELE